MPIGQEGKNPWPELRTVSCSTDRPTRSLVTIPTEPSRLIINKQRRHMPQSWTLAHFCYQTLRVILHVVISLPTEIFILFHLCPFYRHKTDWMTEQWTQPVNVLMLLSGDHTADMPNRCTTGGEHKHVLMHIHCASCQHQQISFNVHLYFTQHISDKQPAAHNWFSYNKKLETLCLK